MTAGDRVSDSLTTSSRKGTCYVEHPVTKRHPGTPRSLDKRREGVFCPCGMQPALTGACVNCD